MLFKKDNIFVLNHKLQEEFKTINSINCKHLSIQSRYYFTQYSTIYMHVP